MGSASTISRRAWPTRPVPPVTRTTVLVGVAEEEGAGGAAADLLVVVVVVASMGIPAAIDFDGASFETSAGAGSIVVVPAGGGVIPFFFFSLTRGRG